jgi:simple sugar transport system ATP-binding protein
MKLEGSRASLEDGISVLEARAINKSFPGVVANADANFTLRQGEIHALLGENGAGKSTLASIMTGLYHPDGGEIFVHGKPVRFRNPGDALSFGIGIIHQHFRLVESFTVAENVVLGDRRQSFFASRRQNELVAALGAQFELKVDPRARISDLAMGERQRVEIVKMLYRNVDVLFLDEPTAVLTPQEVDSLFRTLRAMAAGGKSMVLTTHKLEEVMAVADRATVMRHGRVVGSVRIAETNVAELARMMVGRDHTYTALRRSSGDAGKPVIVADKLSLVGWHRVAGETIDFAVRAGEILGVAGVAGNGQLQLAETIAGIRKPQSGAIRLNDADTTGKGPRAARAAGLAYVPQDRLGTGLARGLSIADNLRLTQRAPFVSGRGGAERAAADAIARFGIKTRGPREVTGRLSGGNVQKVLLARELRAEATAIVIASPTQGLDVAAIEFVRGLLDEHRAAGGAILLISEDLDEIRALSDRILVMYAGRMVMECDAADSNLTDLGLAMAGSAAR